MSISARLSATPHVPPARDTPAGISAVALTRRFGQVVAVDHIDFRVAQGEILALLGPNGAGKTTTVRMVAGLLRPSEGSCRVAGFDVILEADGVRRAVGLMTDEPGVYKEMKTRPYLEWVGRLYGLRRADSHRRADELIDQMGLGQWAAAPLRTLSRGNQQRVALARTLLHDPEVLLLDEPTASLDPEATAALRDLFRALRQAGRTIVLCTHNLPEAEKVADSVAILMAGKIVHYRRLGPPRVRAFQAIVRATASIAPPSLEAIAGVEPGSVRIRADDHTVVYETAAVEATNPRVAAFLVERSCGLVELRERTETLEDVYFRCLGGPGP